MVSLNALCIDFFYIGREGWWKRKKKSIDTFLSENAVINYIEKLLVIFLILYIRIFLLFLMFLKSLGRPTQHGVFPLFGNNFLFLPTFLDCE